jgi:multisubunit Na+/H+ antiporter MnhG subunit
MLQPITDGVRVPLNSKALKTLGTAAAAFFLFSAPLGLFSLIHLMDRQHMDLRASIYLFSLFVGMLIIVWILAWVAIKMERSYKRQNREELR